jgi:hypothetical protein
MDWMAVPALTVPGASGGQFVGLRRGSLWESGVDMSYGTGTGCSAPAIASSRAVVDAACHKSSVWSDALGRLDAYRDYVKEWREQFGGDAENDENHSELSTGGRFSI